MSAAILAGWIPEEWRPLPTLAPAREQPAAPADPLPQLLSAIHRHGSKWVADAVGCGESVVYHWVNRIYRPGVKYEAEIARLTNTDVEAWAYHRTALSRARAGR